MTLIIHKKHVTSSNIHPNYTAVYLSHKISSEPVSNIKHKSTRAYSKDSNQSARFGSFVISKQPNLRQAFPSRVYTNYGNTKGSGQKIRSLAPLNTSVWVFNTFLASSNFCRLLNTLANSFDPDQDQQNVGPDLDQNHFTL